MSSKRNRYATWKWAVLPTALWACLWACASFADDFGTPLTSPIAVASLSAPPYGTAVARDASGNFAVLWRASPSVLMQVQKFAADGTPLTVPVEVGVGGTGQRQLAMDDAGDFVVAGELSYYSEGVLAQKIVAQVYLPDGTPSGGLITVAEFGRGVNSEGNYIVGTYLGGVRVAMSASGDFVVGWAGYINYGNKPNFPLDVYQSEFVQSRRYHLDGTPYGDVVDVDHQVAFVIELATPQITGLDMNAAGAYAITWNRSLHTSNSHCHARFYSADGTPISPDITLPSSIKPEVKTDSNVDCSDSIAVTNSGDVIFLWQVVNSTEYPTVETDYLGRYSAKGSLKTQPTPILTRSYTSGVQFFFGFGGLTVDATSSNGSVVTWGTLGDIYPGETPLTIFAQAYDANDLPVGNSPTLANVTVSPYGIVSYPGILASVLDASNNLILVDGQVTAQRFQGPMTSAAASSKASARSGLKARH